MKRIIYFILFCMITCPAYSIEDKHIDLEPIFLKLEDEEDVEEPSSILFGEAKQKEIYSLDNYMDSERSRSANIDVISREDIKSQNTPSFSQLLNQIGSVTTQNSGSDGNVTSVRIRGTDRVRFTIDGIRADRPSLTTPGVESQFFLADDMERIEVVKGAQGNVLGTNASGGAIAVETRRGRGPLSIEHESSMGNYGGFKERFAIMAGDAKKDYYISTTWNKSSGGMRTSNFGRIYNDGFNALNVVTNFGVRLLDNKAELRDVFRFSNSKKGLGIGYDNATFSYYNDPNNYAKNIDVMNSLSFKHKPSEAYNYDVKFGLYHNKNKNYTLQDWFSPDEYSLSSIGSTRLNFMTQHNFKYKEWNTFSIGYNLENEFIDGTSNSLMYGSWTPFPMNQFSSKYSGSVLQNDVYINDVINIKDKLFIRGGSRLICNSEYGTYVTPNISAALVLPTFKLKGAETKFRGSWGQSVNTPTLYQRYGGFRDSWMAWTGNNNLKAERMTSWDLGLEQSFMDNKLKFEFGYFNSNYKDYLAAYYTMNPLTWYTTGHYINIDEARIQGYEAKATWKPNDKIKFVLNYTYTDSEDKNTGFELPATPKNRLNGLVYWTPVERFNMYMGLETASERAMSSASMDTTPGYVDGKIGANLRLFSKNGLSVYLKANVSNLFNQNICMYKNTMNNMYYYSPKIRFMTGIFLKYNLPEKEKV
ncbi:MAG: TonB-dependent receptor [Cyanobacteria bacterium SIG32]|nr:TonB-dependent receptor [Cyanobacteria bacterium SIG32]